MRRSGCLGTGRVWYDRFAHSCFIMPMKSAYPLAACLVALLALGGGCTSANQPATTPSSQSPDAYSYATSGSMNGDGMPTMPAATSSATSSDVMPSASSSSTHSSSTPSVSDSSPLAFPGVLPAAEVNKKVRIKTTMGDIVIQLAHDQGPNAASNFIYLVKRGFYNGTIFHRVIPGFMIQGGDPTGTGRGGPGYRFEDDTVSSPYNDGVVAMANAGPDTNGSQFFIMVADYPLPPSYSVFGKVVQGLDVAHKIADVSRDADDRPDTEVKMIDVRAE